MLALAAIFATPDATAAQFVVHGGYRLHYTTFASALVPPEVAQAHGIIRGENRIALNISVRKDGQPVTVDLQGTVTNLLNQMSGLNFSEVTERGAVYYLAQHTAAEEDTLRFDILIRFPDKNVAPYGLKFVRSYN